MRIDYTDDEDRPGQFALWNENVKRSIKGKAGQKALREFEAALLALPEKRLIHGMLTNDVGEVCAIGAYARHKGLDLAGFDPEYESDEVGIAAGMPRLVAWEVVAMNDLLFAKVWEIAEGPIPQYGANYKGGVPYVRDMMPEERYERVLTWVRGKLI